MRATTLLLVVLAACGGEQHGTTTAVAIATATPSAPASACADSPAMEAYQPKPAWSGRAASIPDPPMLPIIPRRIGEAYTVYGAVRALAAIDAHETLARDIAIVGYIVDTNFSRAPKCALHHTGRADPPGCVTEIPTFTIADDKAAGADAKRIRVMGFASNFPNVFEALLKERAHDAQPYLDELWATELPRPLPSVSAKVKVTGRYGALFARASTGVVADPRNGILTVNRVEYLEPAIAPASFPQLGTGK